MKQEDGTFGEYAWQTYADVNTIYEEIARGCKALRLLEPIEGVNEDGKQWSFCAIWSKNKWEWHTTELAAMVNKATIIGFYDSMGMESVDYILKQTRLETIFCTAAYLKKILDMRRQGFATIIRNIVMFDDNEESLALRNEATE